MIMKKRPCEISRAIRFRPTRVGGHSLPLPIGAHWFALLRNNDRGVVDMMADLSLSWRWTSAGFYSNLNAHRVQSIMPHRRETQQTTPIVTMAMTSGIQIDARGMKCPRPIIELAKARRQAAPGSVIVITADDLAFESDVNAWCETTLNTLESFVTEVETHTATIRLQ